MGWDWEVSFWFHTFQPQYYLRCLFMDQGAGIFWGNWKVSLTYSSLFFWFLYTMFGSLCLHEVCWFFYSDDSDKASGILMNNLKVLASHRKGLFESMEQLFKSENKKYDLITSFDCRFGNYRCSDEFYLIVRLCREHILYSQYKGTEVGRILTMDHVKKDIEADSLVSGKLKFPINQSNRLFNLIIQR